LARARDASRVRVRVTARATRREPREATLAGRQDPRVRLRVTRGARELGVEAGEREPEPRVIELLARAARRREEAPRADERTLRTVVLDVAPAAVARVAVERPVQSARRRELLRDRRVAREARRVHARAPRAVAELAALASGELGLARVDD